jgi:RNA methyltransferase, TrmH family
MTKKRFMKRGRKQDGSMGRIPHRPEAIHSNTFQSTTESQHETPRHPGAAVSHDPETASRGLAVPAGRLRASSFARIGALPDAIESPRNPLIQEVRRAASGGAATTEGLVAAEGPHLLGEALSGKWALEVVLATRAARTRFAALFARSKAAVIECSERAMEAASGTEHSQGVIALLRPKAWTWQDLLASNPKRGAPLVVLLDSLQDAGNAGTIFRSAEAFGATGVVLLEGSVHPANGKLVRASAGSLFRVPFLAHVNRGQALDRLTAAGCRIYGLAAASTGLRTGEPAFAGLRTGKQAGTRATASQTYDLLNVTLSHATALVIGNEGAGLSPEVSAKAHLVSVPTQDVESLNAAVACSIALFEARRQRAAGGAP